MFINASVCNHFTKHRLIDKSYEETIFVYNDYYPICNKILITSENMRIKICCNFIKKIQI